MPMFAIALALVSLAQAPAKPVPPTAILKAALGGICTADFTVKDAGGKPVYAAMIHVRVRYGAFGIKRADLEVGTDSDGKARIEGLPEKARPLVYDIKKNGLEGSAEQDVEEKCQATFDVTIK
ncbi:MAG: hypothetical protein LAO77_13050 [Acidobacteriia bacterium]|nr:hypothetical protein [Terriglobia bacterium]